MLHVSFVVCGFGLMAELRLLDTEQRHVMHLIVGLPGIMLMRRPLCINVACKRPFQLEMTGLRKANGLGTVVINWIL